jgi:CRISPR/Cas system CMR subunit Cmr6 (Cas7 group RAMP superfamily)
MYKGTCERLTELPEEENKRKMNKVLKTLRKNEYISFFTLNSRRTAEKELDKLFLNLSDLLAKVDIVTSRRAKLGISAAYIAGDELRLMLLIPARNFELIDEVAL